jgi:hypothetical protein
LKRILILLITLLPAALIAQQVPVSVSLTASPAGSANVGTTITLTATASTSTKPLAAGLGKEIQNAFRYTFTAQRTWPCAESTTVATKVATKTVTWKPRAGVYNIAVTAQIGMMPLGTGARPHPSGEGSASLNNFTVRPTSTGINYIGTTFSPDSGNAVAPATVGLTVSIANPPEFKWWRYSIFGIGSPQTKDQQGSSAQFTLNIPTAGTYSLSPSVDQINQADCNWEASVTTHSNPYYYVVKAQ